MISVVIPTMWKHLPFAEVLPFIISHPTVGQVIIINNNEADTPSLHCLDDPKVLVVTPEKNIYVNPSWNLGVKLSTYDKICIYSDDVSIDLRLFDKADEFLNKGVGVLGVCPGNIEQNQPPVTTGEIDIIEWPSDPFISNWAFGSCFFMMRENWNEIPEPLKIWYGDYYQWECSLKEGRKNYLATNIVYYSPQSVTVKTLTEPVNVDMAEDKFYRTLF